MRKLPNANKISSSELILRHRQHMIRLILILSILPLAAAAEQTAPAPNIVVQPSPILVREIPPAQVIVPQNPQPFRIAVAQAGWFERYQTFLAGLAAVLGGALAFIGTLVSINHSRRQAERQYDQIRDTEKRLATAAARQIASALSGELSAYITTLVRFNTAQIHRENAEALRRGRSVSADSTQVNPDYFVIYRSNGREVGALPRRLGKSVAQSYNHCAHVESLDDALAQAVHQSGNAAAVFDNVATHIDRTVAFTNHTIRALDLFADASSPQEIEAVLDQQAALEQP